MVDDLYHFRDHFFENHSLEEAKEKNMKVELKMKETLEKLDQLECRKSSKIVVFVFALTSWLQ